MAKKSQIRIGGKVIVNRGDVRGEKEAIVTETPPLIEDIMGETHRFEDSVIVKYPNTSMGKMFADITERIKLKNIDKIE